MPQNKRQLDLPKGVDYARRAGQLLGFCLIGLGGIAVIRGLEGPFESFRSGYFLLYGMLLNLPFTRFSVVRWQWAYALLILSSIAFVFVMVVSVMFDYMAAAERGERLGVPGLQGSLIFLALLQLPAVLFQRKPDLMD